MSDQGDRYGTGGRLVEKEAGKGLISKESLRLIDNKMVKPHARIRHLSRRAKHDYEKSIHSPAEHRSHGKESYRKTHYPGHVREAERR